MVNKIIVCCAAVLTIILGIFFAIISRDGGTTFAAVFKTRPYDRGYIYKGTGTVKAALDEEVIKTIPGFPGGESGQAFLDTLKEDLSSMDMEIELKGRGGGGCELTTLKLISVDGGEYGSSYYRDGTEEWYSTFGEGRDEKWSKVMPSEGIENIAAYIGIENLERIKDTIVLKAQGESSSTFQVDITQTNAELFFGEKGKKYLAPVDGEFNKLIESMGLSMEIITSDRVDVFTRYAKISNVKASFVLPYSSMSRRTVPCLMGPEERKIVDSMYMVVSITMDFSYEDVEDIRPATA